MFRSSQLKSDLNETDFSGAIMLISQDPKGMTHFLFPKPKGISTYKYIIKYKKCSITRVGST